MHTHLPPCESSRASSTQRLNIKARDRADVYQMEDFTWIPNSGNLSGWGGQGTGRLGPHFYLVTCCSQAGLLSFGTPDA